MKLKELMFFSFIMIIFTTVSYSQNKYLTTKDSDKEAIDIIKETQRKLKEASSIEFDYTYTSRMKDDAPVEVNGIGKQKSGKYYIEMGDQTIYCDGKSIVIYFNTNNEAQINDLDEDSGQLTPGAILNTFDTESYIYVLSVDRKIKNKAFYNIIFKPVDKYSEYIKVDVLINKKTFLPYQIKMLMRDGSQNILKINSIKMNQKINDNVFIFDNSKHPGVSVEDLRMN